MKWIKISDRLPDGQDTLIYVKEGYTAIARCYDDIDGNSCFMNQFNTVWNLNEVTHWAELPENPRTKENFKIDGF